MLKAWLVIGNRAMSTLPSLDMLVGQAKRHKSLSKLSDDKTICWLFLKYESTAVVNVCKGLKAVPVTVTDAQ